MGSDRRGVLLIVLVATALRFLAGEFGGLSGVSVKEVLPFMAISLFLLGTHIFRELDAARMEALSHVRPVILAIESTTFYALIYFLSRLLLAFITPPVAEGRLFVLLIGLQIGLLIAFFYVIYRASVTASSSSMEAIRGSDEAATLVEMFMREKRYLAYAVAASVAFVYILSIMSGSVAFVGDAAIVVIVLILAGIYLEGRKTYVYCYRILGEKECELVDKLHMSNSILMLFVVVNAVQELLFGRAGAVDPLVLVSGTAQLAALFMVFVSTYLVLVRFRHAATVVEVGEKGYRQSLL